MDRLRPRPWVNIELGAAWIKRVPIIPLCHSGLTPSDLPWPFADFHAWLAGVKGWGRQIGPRAPPETGLLRWVGNPPAIR